MKYSLCAGLMLAVALMAFGCSGSTDSQLRQGDVNDPEFQAIQPQLEQAIAQAVGNMDWAMDYSFNSPADTVAPLKQVRNAYSPNAAVDTFSYSWDPVNGWHVAYALFSDSGVTGSVLDSVQFRDAASQFQQDYDSATTDYIRVIQQIDVNMTDPLLGTMDLAAGFDMTLSGLTTGIVTVNGSSDLGFAMSISDSTGTCNIDMSFAEVVSNVTFAKPATADDGVCPISGSLSLVGAINAACSGQGSTGTQSESWTVNATFNGDGTMDVEAQSGNTVWTYSGVIPCGNYDSPF